jgi:protein involved in polysaccharide export with SLBB domain
MLCKLGENDMSSECFGGPKPQAIATQKTNFTFQYRNALCLLLAIAAAGCSSAPNIQTDSADVALSSYAGPRPTRGSDGPYVLGPGDRLRIKVYNDADLTGEYEINSAGIVSVPLVGQVRATGLTTSQLEQALATRMKGRFAQDPKINVEVATYAPFYIFGEVKKAGEYPYQPGLTVADAIATAGGLTYRANESKIVVQRADSHIQQTVTLDVPARIFPGDNIRVSERMF